MSLVFFVLAGMVFATGLAVAEMTNPLKVRAFLDVTGAWDPSLLLTMCGAIGTFALLNILVHHSGYALPWAPWSMPHDWHHYRVKELFGTTGFIDRMLGTSPEFETLEDGELR